MSTAVTAIDDLANHTRLLVFEDRSTFPGSINIIPFPEKRTNILYDGKVYDWYGREALINPHIAKIITPFEHPISYSKTDQSYGYFIAKLCTGDYALVNLKYHASQKIYNSDDFDVKYAITGGITDCTPYIDFEEENIIRSQKLIDYASKIDTP